MRAFGRTGRIVYVESWSDRTADARFSNLRIASTDGKQKRRWTQGNWRDWSPRWAPDGSRIAWLSARKGKTSIHLLAWDQTEEQILPTGSEQPLAIAWSPEGDAIAYLARKAANAPQAWAPGELLPFLRRDGAVTGIFRVGIQNSDNRTRSRARI